VAELTNLESKLGGRRRARVVARAHAEGGEGDRRAAYLDQAADALDGYEFMTMAEAGEVGHWEILATLNERAGKSEVRELAAWSIPIRRRHFEDARQASLKLAAKEDPDETS